MKESYEIKNPASGIYICTYDTDRFKTSKISVNMVLPLKEESGDQAILAYLLSKSCKAYPGYVEMNRRLAELYGATLVPSVVKLGENQVLRFKMTVLDNRFALEGEDLLIQGIDLLMKVVFEPLTEGTAFLEEEVEKEKRLFKERIRNRKDDKRKYAMLRAKEVMFSGETYAYSNLGSEEMVDSFTPEGLYKTWQKVVSEAGIYINVVGQVDEDKLEHIVLSYIGKIKRKSPVLFHTEVLEKPVNFKSVKEEQDIKQGKLVMGFRTGQHGVPVGCITDGFGINSTFEQMELIEKSNKEEAIMRVMADLLGGGTYSRCFMNVREKLSLCYYCSAIYESRKGVLFVQSGVETADAKKASDAVKEQIALMAAGEVDEETLFKSFRSFKDSFKAVSDTPGEIEGWIFSQLGRAPFLTPDEMAKRLLSVTVSEVVEAAGKLQLDTEFLLAGKETDNEQ